MWINFYLANQRNEKEAKKPPTFNKQLNCQGNNQKAKRGSLTSQEKRGDGGGTTQLEGTQQANFSFRLVSHQPAKTRNELFTYAFAAPCAQLISHTVQMAAPWFVSTALDWV